MARLIDGRLVSGWDKAAAFLLAISEESRKDFFSHLSERDIRDLSFSMSTLGVIDSPVVDRVLEEFLEGMLGGKSVMGTYEGTRRILVGVLGEERAQQMLEGVEDEKSTIWDQLSYVHEDLLAGFLKGEQPQTIAVILSRLVPTRSALLLKVLPEDLAFEVMLRMLKTSTVKKEMLAELQRSIKVEFMEELNRTGRTPDSHKILAEIFNAFDNQTESFFMNALERVAPDSALKVKSLMFTFQDLVRLDRLGIQILIRDVDKATLAMALKGAPASLKEFFFSNMSERAGKLLREDMAFLGSVRMRDVEEAQDQVVAMVKQLESSGALSVPESTENDELVS